MRKTNVYCVDCGRLNYKSVNPNYESNKRYKGCDFSVENLDNFAYVDLWDAIQKAKEYSSEHLNYAIVSIYETELDDFDYDILKAKKQVRGLAKELNKANPSKVVWSVYRFGDKSEIDFIQTGSNMINDANTKFVNNNLLKKSFATIFKK